jgi:hypothetical protein
MTSTSRGERANYNHVDDREDVLAYAHKVGIRTRQFDSAWYIVPAIAVFCGFLLFICIKLGDWSPIDWGPWRQSNSGDKGHQDVATNASAPTSLASGPYTADTKEVAEKV